MKSLIAAAWFFLVLNHERMAEIGPFADQAQCSRIVAAVQARGDQHITPTQCYER